MAIISTTSTGTAAVSASLRNYFNKRLLEYAVPNFKYAEDALKSPLPQKMGTNSNVTWFRWAAPVTSDIVTLTEGTAPTARKSIALTTVTAALTQYGEVVSVTDLLSAQELFNTVDQGVRAIGEDTAYHLDTITRAAILAGLSGNQVIAGTGTTGGLTGATAQLIDAQDLLLAATELKLDNAPKIGGYYHAICPPNICKDLMAATGAGDWLDIHKYVGNQPLLDGEIGRAYGVRVKESTIDPVHTQASAMQTANTAAATASVSVYPSWVYGRDAYGIADLTSQSPYAPSINIVTGPDKTDPLNQQTLIGWKAHFAAQALNAAFGSVIQANSSMTVS